MAGPGGHRGPPAALPGVAGDDLPRRGGFIVDGRLVEVGDPGRMRRRHGVPEVLATWEGGSARFPLAGLADDEDFRTALRLHRVQSLHSQEADLAEVFLAVTGRSLG